MDNLSPQNLKSILHSKRANIFYLEKCRVMQKSGRVLYLTEEKKDKQYWNIPIANTTCLLLGTGTSITQAAMRMLASAGVLVGFSGGGATPLIAANDANAFLNHGNYLAYGLAATTLWVLGIPHGFAVFHGKTRRGALVFDVADLIKDTLILPWAFICAKEGATEQEFRQQCLQNFTKHKALDFMFDTVKEMSKGVSPLRT